MKNITHTQNETWKAINGYPNYEVSNLGRVRSLLRTITLEDGQQREVGGRILKQGTTSRGYKNVGIRNENGVLTRNVHRLVMETFDPEGIMQSINHKDEDQTNNHIDNLEWCTQSYNSTYNGANIRRSKHVYMYDKELKLIKLYRTANEAIADNEGVSATGISNAATGKLKTHAGYIWSYTNIHEDILNTTVSHLKNTLTNLIDELTTFNKAA